MRRRSFIPQREGNLTHTHYCECIQNFIFRSILKCVTFFSGSTGNESHFYSAAARCECRVGNGPSRLRYTRLTSVSPISKILRLCFQTKYDTNFISSPINSLPIKHTFDIKYSKILPVLLYKTQISKFMCIFTIAQNTNTIYAMLFS
jgi:hypothetical protein